MVDTTASTTLPDGKRSSIPPNCAPPWKRAKTHAARGEPPRKLTVRQRKTGRHSQLMNMPMDVMMEIFGHLHPFDLLHLARTTKAFRNFLMHRTSISAWRAARSNVLGFPGCPPEVSEPQWAFLAFDPRCNFCYRPTTRNVDWILRIRICLKCTKMHIMEHVDIFDLRNAVPFRLGKGGYREYLKHERDRVKVQYLAIEYANARKAFIWQREKIVNSRRAHADLCQKWAEAQALDRSSEITRVKTSRYESIVERLTALGWGDEIAALPEANSLSTHKLVKTSQLLTERIWEKICEPLIEYLEEMKTKRLALERTRLQRQLKMHAINLLRAYKTRCAPFSVMPEPLDFFTFEPIKELFDNGNDDIEAFMDLFPFLDVMIERWHEEIIAEFLKGMESNINIPGISIESDNTAVVGREVKLESAEDLDVPKEHYMTLASTVYRCTSCCRQPLTDWTTSNFIGYPYSEFPWFSRAPNCNPLWFPRVLGHRCLTKPNGFDLTAEYPTRLDFLHWYRRRWSCESIEIDHKASEVAEIVIRACGLNPRNAHADDMDDLDARLECLACMDPAEDDPSHHVFGWRSAVKHQREHHPSELGSWRQLTSHEADKARLEERSLALYLPKELTPSNQKVLLCLHCLDLPSELSWMTLKEIEDHLRKCHNINSPIMNHDYVEDFAAPEIYATKTLSNASIVTFSDPRYL